MHIKFLDHGKGSAAHASAYVLDKLDHLGNVRAGVEVLRGDATTFNAVCNASPHLWKYTSGVIAWSKEDDPTNEQIQEVLDDFEKHAFAGLEQLQYHLFAVQHTDEDGSKHIHVLTPRLDIQSGKSLNIAAPGHEKHFDSFRDYFNTKYQWSRPDDLLLMQTTQEPNHIAKLNKHAKNILSRQELETLTKKQFSKTVDNYVKTLLKTQTAENRADIVECIEQVKGVEAVKQSKEFLTVILISGKKHRLKGDFYHEQFEIELYSERLRAEAESRPTANELTQAIGDAKSVRDDYRAKREAYNSKQYAFTSSTTNDNIPQIASKLDIDRDRQSITRSPKRDDSELQSANRRTDDSASDYRYIGDFDSKAEHRFVFSITPRPPSDHKPPVTRHQDRPTKSTEIHPNPSRESDREQIRTNREPTREPNKREARQPSETALDMGDHRLWSTDAFNDFLSDLSAKFKQKDDRVTETRNSADLYEITSHADRNRPIFDRAKQLIDATKQLVSRAKQGFESTSRFIKDHLDRIQRSRAEITGQNQHLAIGDRRTSSLDLGAQNRAIQNRAGQFFAGFTAKLSSQLNESTANAINPSLKSAEFKRHYQQLSENSDITGTKDYHRTADRLRKSSLEALSTQSIANYRRRIGDSEQANKGARENAWRLNNIDIQLKQVTHLIENIRLEPRPASDFINLRYDGYYPDYVKFHETLTKKQDQAYRSKKHFQLIDFIAEKTDNLERYMNRASSNISTSDYDQIEKIIKNDERMLKYLKCEVILEPKNDHFDSQRQVYKKCLATFEDIKSLITEKKNPTPEKYFSQSSPEPENKPKLKQSRDFDF